MVTYESKSDVIKLFKKRPATKELGLPIICKHSILSKLFPHIGQSHVVWIGRDRVVKAITYSKYVTESNLNKLIKKGNISLPPKYNLMSMDISKPSSSYRGYDFGNFILRNSVLTGPIEGLNEGAGNRKVDAYRFRLHAENLTVSQLYAFAYQHKIAVLSQELQYYILYNKEDKRLLKKYCHEQIYLFKNFKKNVIQAYKRCMKI